MQRKRSILVIGSLALFVAAFAENARAHDEPVVGSLVGAGIGAAIGGPPGAAVGAVIGAAFGSHAAHETDHGHAHHARHAHRRHVVQRREVVAQPLYIEEVRYARPAQVAYTNGNGHYHATGQGQCVKRVARKVVEKPKMRTVCRTVPVNQVVASR